MEAVVITGLAQGIGREVAKLLARSKVPVAGFDVDKEGIESLNQELEDAGCDHLLTTLDIVDRPGILQFRDMVLEKFGRVDVVVSNVGIGFFGPFEEVDLEKALKCMEINVIGTAAIFQAFLPSMRENRKGRLIAVSSLVGQIPFPFESIYSASKFAVEGYTDTLANELASTPAHVSAVEPGGFKSNIVENLQDRALALAEAGDLELNSEVRASLQESVASRQTMKEPDAVAQAVLDLMTTDTPKRRYMVTPNEEQAQITIRSALQRLLELNQDQPYAYDRDGLVALLDELMAQDEKKPD